MRSTIPILGLLVACAAEPPCDFRDHTYLITARQLSGDCGELQPYLQMPTTTVPPGCEKQDIPADGVCGIGRRQGCRDKDGSETLVTITIHRQDDDATYVGHSDVTDLNPDGSQACRSLYALTLTPQ